MARVLTVKDAHTLMNQLVRQATGQAAIAVVDASTFVSAGEKVLATGTENTMNALSLVLGRTFAAVRPYKARLLSINAINTGVYSHRIRKISYYTKDAVASGWFNNDLYTNHAEGFTAGENIGGTPPVAQSTKSQWEQNVPMPLEINFGGSSTWQDCITMYEDELQQAFNSESSFNAFIEGILVNHGNLIELQKESFNRMTLLSAIAARNYLSANFPSMKINLTAAYNAYFGTSYTSAQLRSTYLTSFLEFMTAKIKETEDRFTENGTAYHDPMTKTVDGVSYSILRHTPKDRQKLLMYGPLFRMAEAIVKPEIFRPEYLDMDKQFEAVEFWQSNASETARAQVKFNGAYMDSNGVQQATGDQEIPYIVAVLMDEDSVMVDYQLERATTTGLEGRKGYRNSWLTFSRNSLVDQSENMVIFTMED